MNNEFQPDEVLQDMNLNSEMYSGRKLKNEFSYINFYMDLVAESVSHINDKLDKPLVALSTVLRNALSSDIAQTIAQTGGINIDQIAENIKAALSSDSNFIAAVNNNSIDSSSLSTVIKNALLSDTQFVSQLSSENVDLEQVISTVKQSLVADNDFKASLGQVDAIALSASIKDAMTSDEDFVARLRNEQINQSELSSAIKTTLLADDDFIAQLSSVILHQSEDSSLSELQDMLNDLYDLPDAETIGMTDEELLEILNEQ